jgi:hypothetical protein
MNYRIFAHSRSGHHAFINWFAHQLNGSVVFHNNCMKGWKDKKLISNKKVIKKYGKPPYKHRIYSFEYFNLENYEKFDFGNWDNEYVDIIFLRDYFNWLASSFKLKPNDMRFTQKWRNLRGEIDIPIIESWKQYGEEFLENKYIPSPVFVKYNDWFASKPYRKNLCEQLNVRFTDVGINQVSIFGDGSSYSKLAIKTNAQQKLKTNDRWKNHVNDDKYLIHVENNLDIVNINEIIFGMKMKSLRPLKIIQI